jgi:hypothetical protein
MQHNFDIYVLDIYFSFKTKIKWLNEDSSIYSELQLHSFSEARCQQLQKLYTFFGAGAVPNLIKLALLHNIADAKTYMAFAIFISSKDQ